MRWKILRAPMMADTITDRPGRVSTMSAAPRAASVAPAHSNASSKEQYASLQYEYLHQRCQPQHASGLGILM